jgi:cytoskeletal protein CcmA (bactofilin family)
MNWRIREPRTTDQKLPAGARATRYTLVFVARLLLVFALLLPASVAAQEREAALVIPAGRTYDGDLATITRDIQIEGTVNGDVTSWSGAILISGHVEGDVVSYSGRVTIGAGAHIGGHVLASGGALQLDAGAAVAGQAIRGESGGVALANLLDLFSSDGASGGEGAAGRVLFGAALGVFLLAFALLSIAFWPRRVATASLTLRQVPGRALALGLLTTLLLLLALPPLAAILAATLVGLPLLVVLLAIVQAPYIYGLATLARAVGALPYFSASPLTRGAGESRSSGSLERRRERDSDGLSRATVLIAGALALLVAVGAALAPLWGMALFYLLASPGLGAALLSRGGLLVPAYE